MGNTILMDKILKLIIEDISVTRAEQISSQLNVAKGTVLFLLKEMEKSGHIRLMKVGSGGVYVIILTSAGRQYYKSSASYAKLIKETATEDKNLPVKSFKLSKKFLTWSIIGILSAILIALIIGYKQGWFS